MECLHFLNSKGPFFFFFWFHGKLATPVFQDCQLNKQITVISLQLLWKSNGVLTPPPEAQHNWIFLVNPADWNVIRQNRAVVGVKRMGKGWRILGSGYSKNKCLLTVQHSRGSEQIQTRMKRRRPARSPASPAGACGAERTAPCVRLERELLRARRQRAGSWQLSARWLARSLAPPPTGKRAPTPSVIWHHLLFLMQGHNHSMGQNGFKKVGGILAIKKKKN